jgi:hypothetical protein
MVCEGNNMRLRLFGFIAIWVVVMACGSGLVAAQGGADACPVLVESALDLAQESCARLDRNEVCYGNTLVAAIGWDAVSLPDFTVPGDTASVLDLASIETAALNVEQNQWGVAVMALQADLPGTLPGQVVTFVLFGEAEIRSEVPPAGIAPPPQTCAATATGGLNVRGGPGTGYPVVGGLAAGEQIILTGRNPAGDWVTFEADGESAWVYAPLLDTDCDPAALPVVAGFAGGTRYAAPLQAFYLRTGSGVPVCEEAPRNGVLVQTPEDTTVHFRINGVEVMVGSTAFFEEQDGALVVNTLEGMVTVTAKGRTQIVAPGYRVVAGREAAPTAPAPYDRADVSSMPLELLPHRVSVPFVLLPSGGWMNSRILVRPGQTFVIRADGLINLWPLCEEQKASVGFADRSCTEWILGPEGGLGPAEPGYPIPGQPIAGLVARISRGEPFFVGRSGRFVADTAGTLQFRINDKDEYTEDDTRLFTIWVDLYPAE